MAKHKTVSATDRAVNVGEPANYSHGAINRSVGGQRTLYVQDVAVWNSFVDLAKSQGFSMSEYVTKALVAFSSGNVECQKCKRMSEILLAGAQPVSKKRK